MWPFGKKLKQDDLDKRRLESFGVLAAVSFLCIGSERLPVIHGVRESPNNISDSGWILSSGHESPAFTSNPANYKLVPLEMMIQADPSLAPMRDWPVGTEVTRLHCGEPWRFIVDDIVIDDGGKIVGELGDAT